MPVHCEQYDVHDPANICAILDSEDVEEVVEDVLQHRRSVEVLLTGDQNLRLIRISRHLKRGANFRYIMYKHNSIKNRTSDVTGQSP